MSNNIVQLVDKNGNNIFPVAGSMASDSVTTAMLQDGAVTTDKIASSAVTSDNIDYTTLVSHTVTVTKNTTYVGNVETSIVRQMGNLVEFHMVFTLSANISSSTQALFSDFPEVTGLPQFVGVSISGNNQDPVRLTIDSRGNLKVWYNVSSLLTSGHTIAISGSYFTK